MIDRPIEEVFAFLADGETTRSSARGCSRWPRRRTGRRCRHRLRQHRQGRRVKTKREIKITEFTPPTRIRWAEVSKNLVTASEGGYDLTPEGSGTRITLYNVLEGHGFGRLIEGFALRGARKGADDFGKSIKRAVEDA